jgi:hypothetical protein
MYNIVDFIQGHRLPFGSLFDHLEGRRCDPLQMQGIIFYPNDKLV